MACRVEMSTDPMQLYAFIDTLPEELELRYNSLVHQLEEEEAVEYITSAERIGEQRGMQIGEQRGHLKAIRRMVLNMLAAGMKREKIAEVTKLELNFIEKLESVNIALNGDISY